MKAGRPQRVDSSLTKTSRTPSFWQTSEGSRRSGVSAKSGNRWWKDSISGCNSWSEVQSFAWLLRYIIIVFQRSEASENKMLTEEMECPTFRTKHQGLIVQQEPLAATGLVIMRWRRKTKNQSMGFVPSCAGVRLGLSDISVMERSDSSS